MFTVLFSPVMLSRKEMMGGVSKPEQLKLADCRNMCEVGKDDKLNIMVVMLT